ncbi:MAG: VWA domain-containing protein [Pseudomonas sp.]|uniref:vWA domain-containing protein n=1 Tax=Pseudomonas sp. TaxID=306 RepID=UPI00339ABFC2
MANGTRGPQRPGHTGSIDWLATLLHGRPLRRGDLVLQARSQRPGQLWVVLVDASASTQRHGALGQAKGLLAQVFAQAYRQRVRLTLVQASGNQPHWQWQGWRAAASAQRWLDSLGASGGTPLVQALSETAQWLARRQRQHPTEQRRLLILTDGRLRDWPALPTLDCPALLVDIECAPIRLGGARRLAHALGAEYRHIESLPVAKNNP